MTVALDLLSSIAVAWALLRLVALPRGLRAVLIALGAGAVFSAAGSAEQLFRFPAWTIEVAFAAVAGLAWTRPRSTAPADPPQHGRGWTLALWAAAALALACAVEHLHRYPDGGADAFIIWNLRARWLYRAGNPAAAFSPDILFWTHQDYPLMLPGLVARMFSVFGESAAVPSAIALAFAGMCVVLVAASPFGVFAGLALVTTPNLVTLTATQQADIPLAAFVAATVAILLAPGERDGRRIAAAGAFASMAAWTKNEGALLFVLIGVAVLLDDRRRQPLLCYLAGAAPFLALLLAFKLKYAGANDLLQSGAAAVAQRLLDPARWWTLARLALRHAVLLQVWGLHLVAAVGVAVVARAPATQKTFVSWAPAAALLAYAVVYVAQPYDVGYMMQVSLDRLVMQVWPAILIVIAYRLEFAASRFGNVAHRQP